MGRNLFRQSGAPCPSFSVRPSCACRRLQSPQTPTALKMLRAYNTNNTLDPVAHGLALMLNDAMQTILRGIPGSAGRPPQ